MKKWIYIFLFCLAHLSAIHANHNKSVTLQVAFNHIKDIVTYMPEIGNREGDKFYLTNKMEQLHDGEIILFGEYDEVTINPQLIAVDNHGPYLALSSSLLLENLASVGDKPFKNVCFDCKYEWPGGFALRCPNCNSKNIGNRPNKKE